jgi:hypothetical protein
MTVAGATSNLVTLTLAAERHDYMKRIAALRRALDRCVVLRCVL